jgi:hypothetical protein
MLRFLIQSLIHKLEEAGGLRYLRIALAVTVVLAVMILYNFLCFRNFSSPEAMDCAQVGRNLAQGRGFTTEFIRPFSMYLLEEKYRAKSGSSILDPAADAARIRDAHPDISNPPVYPLVLAGLMKTIRFDYPVNVRQSFWSMADPRFPQSGGRKFWRYQPDFLIAVFNEMLLLALVVLVFYWARRLFDRAVAWTSAVLLSATEVLWRFSVSGLSTLLLLVIFMGLIWCLTLWEAEVREPGHRPRTAYLLAAAAGLLVGIGALTRYAFGWLIIPTVLFFIVFSVSHRGVFMLVTVAAFLAVVSPWIYRNYHLSGTPFGTAGFTLLADTSQFPGDRLERSLKPELHFLLSVLWEKLFTNVRIILQTFFSAVGAGWITGFFLAGLLVGFRSPAIRRIRYFCVSSLGLLIVVQALGRTWLSEESPDINSENLLVLLLPVVLVFGVSFFFLLLDQISFPTPVLRLAVIGVFGFFACLPMILALLPPWNGPVAYPPYHPLVIQQTAAWMKNDELMMTDIPWAVAWYGDRQAVWLTLNATGDSNNPDSEENFVYFYDHKKAISGLYLTPKSLDNRFVSGWIRAGDYSWGDFIVNTILKSQVPSDFPLREMPSGYLPEQLFLSDWKRWR